MNPRLRRYLDRLESVLLSRHEIEREYVEIVGRSHKLGQFTLFWAKLHFFDGSLLQVYESLAVKRAKIIKTRYAYQYSDTQGNTLFRYDNVPHYPEISTYPNHKHTSTGIESATVPDLTDILQEIDTRLYGK